MPATELVKLTDKEQNAADHIMAAMMSRYPALSPATAQRLAQDALLHPEQANQAAADAAREAASQWSVYADNKPPARNWGAAFAPPPAPAQAPAADLTKPPEQMNAAEALAAYRQLRSQGKQNTEQGQAILWRLASLDFTARKQALDAMVSAPGVQGDMQRMEAMSIMSDIHSKIQDIINNMR